ncbi:MAG TPA: CUAEP/CCAEP-tail radical SAM protein [Bryobacteraceae bacterium]
MTILLVSTYELGRQPFGLASPRAWLEREGHCVACVDLAVEPLSDAQIHAAEAVAFYLPMHTATRLALPVIERVQRVNPGARLACYGLYAAINAEMLGALGLTVIGGEFETGLVQFARGQAPPLISLERQTFLAPQRSALPSLHQYAKLRMNGSEKLVAYTEASRGCKHRCRHCPVVPVYDGHFRIVQRDAVLEDIRQQVAAGATHVTFGDPDFFNGPRHSLDIVRALHAAFPDITYDVTIKVEHLLRRRDLLETLKQTGCLFVTSAVESLDDAILAKLEKHHTREDVFEIARAMREIGLTLSPTFIAFTPWTTLAGYRDLLQAIAEWEWIEHVAPIQLALRLLVTAGSRLLELEDLRETLGAFDRTALIYPWTHPDPSMDRLASEVLQLVSEQQETERSRLQIFAGVWQLARGQLAQEKSLPERYLQTARSPIPRMDEPWYCCAEPVTAQGRLI